MKKDAVEKINQKKADMAIKPGKSNFKAKPAHG